MGFGSLNLHAQSVLTNFQGAAAEMGGQLQKNMADQQAAAENSQADLVWSQTQLAEQSQARQTEIAVGDQAEGYASSGIEMQGTPLAVMNETRALSQQQINAIDAQGASSRDMLRLQANQTQQQGLSDLLSGQVTAVTGQVKNQIQQAQEKTAAVESIFGGFLGGATSVLSALR